MNTSHNNEKNVEFFVSAFDNVMRQLGFEILRHGSVTLKSNKCVGSGVITVIGVVGELKGNIVYIFSTDSVKKIASKMMMGMSVDEVNDMVKSAISELTNMLTANVATCASSAGITVDISTPTLLEGNNIAVNMNTSQVVNIQFFADEIPVEVNIALI